MDKKKKRSEHMLLLVFRAKPKRLLCVVFIVTIKEVKPDPCRKYTFWGSFITKKILKI